MCLTVMSYLGKNEAKKAAIVVLGKDSVGGLMAQALGFVVYKFGFDFGLAISEFVKV